MLGLVIHKIFQKKKSCESKTPIFWVIDEDDKVNCCIKVKFYNRHNREIHRVQLTYRDKLILDESLIKHLNLIKSQLIRKHC